MSKNTLTLAALVLASTTLTNSAQAGGIRLSFGGPLGSFVAHPHLSSGPGGTMRTRHCAKSYEAPHYSKPSYVSRLRDEDEAPVRHVKQTQPKIEVAEREPSKVSKPVEVKTAKLEDKTTVSDATPAIFVPESPPAANELIGTQSTPAAVHTAALTPEPSTTVKATELEAKKVEAVVPADPKPAEEKTNKTEKTEKSDSLTSKMCRRFSAAVAGLIDVPCGD